MTGAQDSGDEVTELMYTLTICNDLRFCHSLDFVRGHHHRQVSVHRHKAEHDREKIDSLKH